MPWENEKLSHNVIVYIIVDYAYLRHDVVMIDRILIVFYKVRLTSTKYGISWDQTRKANNAYQLLIKDVQYAHNYYIKSITTCLVFIYKHLVS